MMMKIECRDCRKVTSNFVLVYERIGELVPFCDECYNKNFEG